jgi:hypothetical protein
MMRLSIVGKAIARDSGGSKLRGRCSSNLIGRREVQEVNNGLCLLRVLCAAGGLYADLIQPA